VSDTGPYIARRIVMTGRVQGVGYRPFVYRLAHEHALAGYVRNLRGDARWAEVPVIMITSRIADKHRQLAMSLGANHYLGKPYPEDELLGLLARYTRRAD